MATLSSKGRDVMREYGQRKLRSSSGQTVTSPMQAFAIAKSEERRARRKGGGRVMARRRGRRGRKSRRY